VEVLIKVSKQNISKRQSFNNAFVIEDFMGAHGHGRGGKEKKEIDNSKFYNLLGVKKDAT